MVLEGKSQLYLERAKNELDLAKAILKLSGDSKLKSEFELKEDTTFYSNVISNAYYCIFYSAKAFLFSKGVITTFPSEHEKTLNEFEKLAKSGEIDVSLLTIYKEMVVRADELLGILKISTFERDFKGHITPTFRSRFLSLKNCLVNWRV